MEICIFFIDFPTSKFISLRYTFLVRLFWKKTLRYCHRWRWRCCTKTLTFSNISVVTEDISYSAQKESRFPARRISLHRNGVDKR